ncbi:hypothetical protein HX057_02430 [Myroides odoratimimus]|nr:hypothetical protein [Myroides odoratimimus]MDM1445603.1 hypothetical protein [Myroides odoratimimus]MDM1510790.1 hypothetical protein [Myroides odoratimimus]MDM1520375.1 hypothetical protein [Myroides odoratimimus]MDM1526945.1 hypothetical protein [Myroides odoratimimus]
MNICFSKQVFYICRTTSTNISVMKYSVFILSLVIIVSFSSCKINQKVEGEKVGRWVFKSTVEGKQEVQRGKYDNEGFQKGTWRYKRDGKLYKKEVIRDSIAHTTFYHPNHKVEAIGKTVLVKTNKGLHYYYTGSWFIYDIKGRLIQVKHYKKGILEHITTVRE